MAVQTKPFRVLAPLGARRLLGTGRATALIERNARVYHHAWIVLISGLFEPLFYLFSVGVGVAQLVGTVSLTDGQAVSYTEFVAPAMLAASAMNGAVFDATFNVFFKLKYIKLYDQMLVTPLTTADVARGEIAWGQLRGASYSAMFLVVMAAMGLTHTGWAV